VPSVSVRITGSVQGVGFRAFVSRLARDYHLRGEVWNDEDGSVGAVLQSENAGDIDRVLQLLEKGPGRVDNVESNTLAAEPVYDGFSVAYSR
jgi:acylphosphatase